MYIYIRAYIYSYKIAYNNMTYYYYYGHIVTLLARLRMEQYFRLIAKLNLIFFRKKKNLKRKKLS